MKNIIYLLLLAPLTLMGGLDSLKVNSTLMNIKASKPLKFYNGDKSLTIKKVLAASSKESADIILFPLKSENKKIQIVKSYKSLKTNKDSVGAIYFKNDRTQIVFVKERLKKNGLKLSDKYKKYIINECQLSPICLLSMY